VNWKRAWETQIAGSLQGQENRRAMRRTPRTTLTWLVSTGDGEETALLEARIQAALKSGLACTGYWGRSCEIKTNVTADSAELWPGSWPWAAGDYILFIDPDSGLFDALLVDEVTMATGTVALQLHAAVSRTYKQCTLCWPMLFGKLQVDPLAPSTLDKADIKLILVNTLPSPAVVPSCDDWCGHCNTDLWPIPGSPCSAETLAECLPLGTPTGLAIAGADAPCPTAAIHSLTPTLSWGAVTGAAGYVVKIFTGSCGGTLLHTSAVQSGASYAVPGGVLNYATTYYWRVTATPLSGWCDGEASACCAMTTCTQLTAATGLKVDGSSCPTATFGSETPTLTWTAVTGAASYVVKIYHGSCGGTLIHTSTTLSSPSYAVPSGVLDTCQAFYWTVTANPASGYCSAVTSSCCTATPSCPGSSFTLSFDPASMVLTCGSVLGALATEVASITNLVIGPSGSAVLGTMLNKSWDHGEPDCSGAPDNGPTTTNIVCSIGCSAGVCTIRITYGGGTAIEFFNGTVTDTGGCCLTFANTATYIDGLGHDHPRGGSITAVRTS
jgi:hypothetical protein